MTDLVLEASVALTWCFKNEATAAADRVLEHLAAEAAYVPAIWHLEIANVSALSERRRRITPARSAEFVALLETLEIVIDEETPSRALGRVLDLAREERLAAYDAAYLELAMRLGVPARVQGWRFVRCRRAPRGERAQGCLTRDWSAALRGLPRYPRYKTRFSRHGGDTE